MWYYSMRKIDILLFIRFSSFPINKMLYIYSTIQNTEKYKTKELALKGITIILS